MEIVETTLPGVLILLPKRFGDDRGFFAETWNRRALAGRGVDIDFVQDNHSLSARAGTLRGLHFQAPPQAQAKLVRCGRGRLLDVAVDIRSGAPTYGGWVAEELSAANGRQLLIPAGFLHGFLTLEDDTEVIYKCSDYYAPEAEGAVLWNSCGIDWGELVTSLPEGPVLSPRDAAAPPLAAFDTPFHAEQ